MLQQVLEIFQAIARAQFRAELSSGSKYIKSNLQQICMRVASIHLKSWACENIIIFCTSTSYSSSCCWISPTPNSNNSNRPGHKMPSTQALCPLMSGKLLACWETREYSSFITTGSCRTAGVHTGTCLTAAQHTRLYEHSRSAYAAWMLGPANTSKAYHSRHNSPMLLCHAGKRLCSRWQSTAASEHSHSCRNRSSGLRLASAFGGAVVLVVRLDSC